MTAALYKSTIPRADIQSLVCDHYELGELVEVKEILGGYCNKSYALIMERDGRRRTLLLRKYNPQTAGGGIRFEHALLNHLHANGFESAPQVIGCRNGDSYVSLTSPGKPPSFWSLFSFLPGKNLYAWTRTDLNASEFDSAAAMLAELHAAGRDFSNPPGANRAEPPIMGCLETFKETFAGYTRSVRGRRCDCLLLDHFKSIIAAVDRCTAASENFNGMIKLPIHCDYHPGNLKYRGGKVVGVFDFDWAKIDYRLFDVALALVYFCGVWKGESAGTLRLGRVKRFLEVYDHACRRLSGLEPLTRQEFDNLLPMLSTANLYVLSWDLRDFYDAANPDDDEYHLYIRHNIRLMEYIEGQSVQIRATAIYAGVAT